MENIKQFQFSIEVMLLLTLFASFIATTWSTLACLEPKTFVARPIPNSFAGEILQLNLEAITDEEWFIVHRLLLKYKVLVFRNQTELTIEGQRAFTQRFGELMVHVTGTAHYPGYDDVNIISNMKNASGFPIGLHGRQVEHFHTDLSW